METARIVYKGNLRTEMTHVRSGNIVITDAPPDNKGKGEFFSPTDLVASALGSCIFTIMGLAAIEHGFSIDGASCSVTKIMTQAPRKIGEVQIEFDLGAYDYSDKEKKILELCVKTCPVALSLSPDVFRNVKLNFRK